MSRAAVLGLMLCGCACAQPVPSPPPPPQQQQQPSPAPQQQPSPAPQQQQQPPPRFTRVTAPPGGAIKLLAVAPTGDAALTIDDADEVRLWPALDGSSEPLVVDLPGGRAAALVRAGSGFAVALGLDGGAIVARVDTDGHVTSHVEVAAVTKLVATGDGFVAWRGGAHETFGPDGEPRALDTTAPHAAIPAIKAVGSDLVITPADGPRYLGYAVPANRNDLEFAGDAAHRVVGNGDRWVRIGAQLARTADVQPWTPPHDHARTLTWIADDTWLATTAKSGVLVDEFATGSGHVALAPTGGSAPSLVYEPTTQLAIIDSERLARFSPASGMFVPLAYKVPSRQMHLVGLAAANPAGVLLVDGERSYEGTDHLILSWIHDVDHPAVGRTSVTLQDKWQTGLDGRGTIFTAPLRGGGSAEAYFDGSAVGPAPSLGGAQAPDGAHAIDLDMVGDAQFAELLAYPAPPSGGTAGAGMPAPSPPQRERVWSKPLELAGLSWLDAKHLLYMPTAGGVALVDLATGELTSARAGWSFELSATPHAVSTVGRPLARTLAAVRDPDIQLAANTAFQTLVRAIAAASHTTILEWGLVMLDGGKPTRTALLKRPGESGTPLFAYIYEPAAGTARVITITSWGFSHFQGEDEHIPEPPWGEENAPDRGLIHGHTLDRTLLPLGSKWIHGSFEQVGIGLAHGEPVILSDEWAEHENMGHGEMETTEGSHSFAQRDAPRLAKWQAHAMRFAVSAAGSDADALGAAIIEAPLAP